MERLSELTVREILDLARGRLSIPHAARITKDTLVAFVSAHGSGELAADVNTTAGRKVEERQQRKRERDEQHHQRRVAQRLDEASAQNTHDTSKFLELPTQSDLDACYKAFYDATSNTALAMAVCAICAREVSVVKDEVEEGSLQELPGHSRLHPTVPHPAHDLFDGCLLEPIGVTRQDEVIFVKTCRSCRTDLRRGTTDAPPKLSLANGLWLGRIPWQLHTLTIPEQLLIALLYPRIYVFKLFPKGAGAFDSGSDTLQRGMRGTVSTYELSPDGVADMIRGNLLPRPPAILASVITITFVGAGTMPKKWLRTTFRVRRHHVGEALRWLQEQNPHYRQIDISPVQLSLLPEDDVPPEVLGVVRQCSDIGAVVQESAGYVPDDEDDEVEEMVGDNGVEREPEPDVVPLQVSGAIDTDLTKMTANEMMMWGLANLWNSGQEGGYAVRHSGQPVSDFGVRARRTGGASGTNIDQDSDEGPNFFERAFPGLFPYGVGGIERRRAVLVEFRDHIQWALQYFDRRFRTHETFPFVSFGILQRREALGSARIQMRRSSFDQEARLLATITRDSLRRAQEQEEASMSIEDPAIKLLRRLIHGTAGRVQGSDAARYKIRAQIWSTCLVHGPPSLWITINPSDIHDPIAQVFAGAAIDLDAFEAATGPSGEERAITIARDPYAAAKFFHFMITTIFEMLFNVKVTPHSVKGGMGVLGRVSSYIGSVESQGRGTLHLHLLLWLQNTPSSAEMHELLRTSEFRDRVVTYIRANLRAYLPGLESAEAVKMIPKDKGIAYSRPPNPSSPDYAQDLKAFELRLARAQQVHTCKVRRCLLYDKTGTLKCKRRAPFEYAEDDYITESGSWCQKRLYRYMNGWIPSILVNARCNNDGKLLTNGADTKNITFYVSSYAGKKQGKNFNLSAVIADAYAYHESHMKPEYVHDLREQQRLLLFRLVHAINREQELAAPMVVSYLMGWGDIKTSHSYSPLYWSSFVGNLLTKFPSLRRIRAQPEDAGGLSGIASTQDPVSEGDPDRDDRDHNDDDQEHNDNVTLDMSSSGKIFAKSQATDYQLRGHELSGCSLLRFIMDTYETDMTPADREEEHGEGEGDGRRGPGRPRNSRSKYLPQHPCSLSKIRVVRTTGHRNLPNIIGKWFPRQDDEDVHDFYCACMLMLLKPWRNLATDLKMTGATWADTFTTFVEQASDSEKLVLSGVQYFHECSMAADADRSNDGVLDNAARHRSRDEADDVEQDPFEEDPSAETVYTEEGLRALKQLQTSPSERVHASFAIQAARRAGFFSETEAIWSIHTDNMLVAVAEGSDFANLETWKTRLENDVRNQQESAAAPPSTSPSQHNDARVDTFDPSQVAPAVPIPGPSIMHMESPEATGSGEEALAPVAVQELREDQRRAYDIMVWHLQETMSGANIPPLRMVLYGEGGTGKSRVIQTVTQAFANRLSTYMLVKSAYTGIAASLIDGKTTHVIARIAVGSEASLSDAAKQLLQAFWRGRRYLILDEFSMLAKTFLALLARRIAIGVMGTGLDEGLSFGGISVILCGTLHQFPPVAQSPAEALYKPVNLATDNENRVLGRKLYEEFTTVVILKEQMRVSDPVWRDFLDHLRYGRVKDEHVAMLRTLICDPLLGQGTNDYTSDQWTGAALVTPRHAVRHRWNAEAVRRWCRERGERLFVVEAEDRIKGREVTLQERYALAGRMATQNRRKKKDLPETLELARGMKVMVTSNIETDLDLANGSRGEIVDIILHPEEPPIGDAPIVKLKFLPAYVLVKMLRTRASQLPGLEANVIPVEPNSCTMRIVLPREGQNPVTRTVRRRQFPMTGAYAFTDYRSQGQTIPLVVVDIKTPPPPGKLSLFNLYVALSRSSGRDTIRVLRDFEDELFMQGHDPDLLAEDDRLEELNQKTKEWWDLMQMQRRVDV